MEKRLSICVLLAAVLTVCGFARGVGSDEQVLSEAASALLEEAGGARDPGVVDRLAVSLSQGDIIAALYGPSRTRRLVALEVAGRLADPWPLMPYLAAFMSAPQRDASSRAAESMLLAIDTLSTRLPGDSENLDGRARQLAAQLLRVAANEILAADVRATALQALGHLEDILILHLPVPLELLEDDEWAVRAGCLALLVPPLSEEQLLQVATMSTDDPVEILRGQSAGLLCENALAHGVKFPSADLVGLLSGLILQAKDGEVLAPMMGCLARFDSTARADLLDTLSKHPDVRVMALWEKLAQE